MRNLDIFYSIILGIFAGPLFFIIAVILDLTKINFDIWLPTLITFLAVFAIFFFKIRISEKKFRIISMTLLVLFSACSIYLALDLLSIGPDPEQRAYLYLLAKLREKSNRIDPNWIVSEWEFYKPICYSSSSSMAYSGSSLEIAVFYYNPYKLLCSYTDSKTAFEKYKKEILSSGFRVVAEGNKSFVAENNTVIVYCLLDGNFIMVAKAVKSDEYLINSALGIESTWSDSYG